MPVGSGGALAGLSGPFTFERAAISGNQVALEYRIGADVELAEIVEFPFALPDTDAVRYAVRVLHLIAGVSYYKCIAPSPLVTPSLLDTERELLTAVYDEGMREFAYRNGLPLPLAVELRETIAAPPGRPGLPAPGTPPPAIPGDGGALVPVGGGKDSALVADLVPDGHLMTVNPTGAHERFAASLGRPLLGVTRELDPRLRELVAAGAPNGHVPVTAINSAVAAVVAVGLGLRDVVMGLERSASEPSLVVDGVEINHQFSKSWRAEQLLRRTFEPLGIRYFSLLRPLTELAIGTSVAGRGLADATVSCNRVFTVWNESTASREQRPCGTCAKCLFTALVLAPSLDPEAVRGHFGHDVFDERGHIEGVRSLWSDAKPFDCVGERMESAAALARLADSPVWSDHLVVAALAPEAGALLAAHGTRVADFLLVGSLDSIPTEYRDRISRLTDAA